MKTRDLDFAAALLTAGHQISVRKLAPTFAEFSYANNEQAKILRYKFFSGTLEQSLSAYMRNRNSLKRETACSETKEDASLRKIIENWTPVRGLPYWYHENGAVFNAVYTDAEPHLSRTIEMRSFKTKLQAQKALAYKNENAL